MLIVRSPVRKPFIAHITNIGLLSSMCQNMPCKMASQIEPPVANLTLEWPFPCVAEEMVTEIPLGSECFFAKLARIAPHSSVGKEVMLEMRLLDKPLVAIFANMQFFSSMGQEVPCQTPLIQISSIAHLACIVIARQTAFVEICIFPRLLFPVSLNVLCENAPPRESPLAYGTDVALFSRVSEHVHCEVAPFREHFPARSAFVVRRSLGGVDELVLPEAVLAREISAANGAHKALFAGVSDEVSLEVALLREGFVAHVA